MKIEMMFSFKFYKFFEANCVSDLFNLTSFPIHTIQVFHISETGFLSFDSNKPAISFFML